MNSFDEIKKQKELTAGLISEFGKFYLEKGVSRDQLIVIKHFDNEYVLQFLPIYVELHNAIINWIDVSEKAKEYVYMPPLLEVGVDYLIRRFYVYYVSIRNYFDKEEDGYIEPPELFGEMRNAVSQELKEVSGREGVIQRILRKSLLEPTGKTIFGYRINKFIIVEPKISVEDLNDWKIISQA